ncbi:unnamed protein product [Caenorhabditis sp. 36 PRJEB53466]|nr:unnamed protein product [Caenorhabditis sp. 36 PRJEB53466]
MAANILTNIDPRNYDHLLHIVESIKKQVGCEVANGEIGIICGSGFGPVADLVTNATIIPYAQIPGFKTTGITGHRGNLVFGTLHGKRVICVQGRFHPYEHDTDLALCSLPVRVLHLLGVKVLIVSNAAGGISSNIRQGELMIIKDQIFLPGLAGRSPLVGVQDPRFGCRFVSMHDAYEKELRVLAQRIAWQVLGKTLHEGVYAMVGGPQFEAPAEVALLKTVGADAVGMSTCHEVTVARQCGIKVLGFSLITNVANLNVDDAVEVCSDEVLDTAKEVGDTASQFVAAVVGALINHNNSLPMSNSS